MEVEIGDQQVPPQLPLLHDEGLRSPGTIKEMMLPRAASIWNDAVSSINNIANDRSMEGEPTTAAAGQSGLLAASVVTGLCLLLATVTLLQRRGRQARLNLGSKNNDPKSRRRSRQRISQLNQQPSFGRRRANSSFADICRDNSKNHSSRRGSTRVDDPTTLLGRIRSATTSLYNYGSFSRKYTTTMTLDRLLSMDVSDNLQRFYTDHDADRLDRQADEALFTRVLEEQQQQDDDRTVVAATTTTASVAPLRLLRSPRLAFTDDILFGPTVTSVHFRTWIPPPTWAEASRNFIASRGTFRNLARTLTWKLGPEPVLVTECNVASSASSSSSSTAKKQLRAGDERKCVALSSVRLEVHRPVERGVLYIHVGGGGSSDDNDGKGTDDDTVVAEHSFRSAHAAAQFQYDITLLQACGRPIYCIFQALCIAQNGSLSSTVAEPIMNGEKGGEDHCEGHGIAWADVMQCLGNEMPSIRFRLDALLYTQTGAARYQPQESSLLQPEYQRKRLLLGVIDFFRLFVPTLPPSAVPAADSGRMRTEHVLRVRKRVARAAVLVQAFVTARCCVVNRGWQIVLVTTDALPRKRRMAYDDPIDDEQYDLTAQREYYETNQKQGYSLVGIHSLPWNGPVDPVLSFRSLRLLVEDNPQLQFWIQSYYIQSQEKLTVKVFVRSLASTIDPQFDAAVTAYSRGDDRYRDGHLQLVIQLGNIREGLSLLGRILLFFLSIIFRWEVGELLSTGSSGTTLPILNLASITAKTLHFGGALCTNASLPNNYVACTGKQVFI
jgi:hypothetical protein